MLLMLHYLKPEGGISNMKIIGIILLVIGILGIILTVMMPELFGYGGLIRGDIGHVAGNEAYGIAQAGQLLGKSLARFVRNIHETDAGALFGKGPYHRLAYAGGAAGNDDGAILEAGILGVAAHGR